MGISKVCFWGDISPEVKQLIVEAAEQGWKDSADWTSLQSGIAGQFMKRFGFDNVRENVHLSDLGVQGSEAQIDIVVSADLADPELAGFLIHISGGSAYPRHEKELLEFMVVSRVDNRFRTGVMVVAIDNEMKLEGHRNSYDYCSRPLLQLAEPELRHSNLAGLLFIGLPTPKNR